MDICRSWARRNIQIEVVLAVLKFHEFYVLGLTVFFIAMPDRAVAEVLEVDKWCIETYGESGHEWQTSLFDDVATFYFSKPEDAVMFKMKWC